MKYISVLLALISPYTMAHAQDITLNDIYEKFNMRTIYSSYGQRLKYYCESYPKEYFSKENAKFINDKQLELVSGSDVWVFTIKASNILLLNNQITSGTYNIGKEFSVYFDSENNDWRADKILIKKSDKCKNYVKE